MIELVISAFFAGFYAYVYKKLEVYLSVLIPAKQKHSPVVGLPERGAEMNLAEFGLTDRQIRLVQEYMDNRTTYKSMADKHNMSESAVKKDMSDVFRRFSVDNINELYFLLSQYVLKARPR